MLIAQEALGSVKIKIITKEWSLFVFHANWHFQRILTFYNLLTLKATECSPDKFLFLLQGENTMISTGSLSFWLFKSFSAYNRKMNKSGSKASTQRRICRPIVCVPQSFCASLLMPKCKALCSVLMRWWSTQDRQAFVDLILQWEDV